VSALYREGGKTLQDSPVNDPHQRAENSPEAWKWRVAVAGPKGELDFPFINLFVNSLGGVVYV
jgi:hypothetical protein